MTITVELTVDGIESAQPLESELTNLEGVHAVEVISDQKLIKVEYNPDDILLDTICKVIQNYGMKIIY